MIIKEFQIKLIRATMPYDRLRMAQYNMRLNTIKVRENLHTSR